MRRCERVNDVLQRNWWSWELCDEVEEIQYAHIYEFEVTARRRVRNLTTENSHH